MLFVRFIFGIFAFYQDRTVYVDRKLREGKDCELGLKAQSTAAFMSVHCPWFCQRRQQHVLLNSWNYDTFFKIYD